MPDTKTEVLESGRRAGHEAAMLAWNGAKQREITRRRLELARHFPLPEKSLFYREYEFWRDRASKRIQKTSAVLNGGAVKGEHAVVFYVDDSFAFIRYEKVTALAAVNKTVAEMLETLKHCSPEAHHVITA